MTCHYLPPPEKNIGPTFARFEKVAHEKGFKRLL